MQDRIVQWCHCHPQHPNENHLGETIVTVMYLTGYKVLDTQISKDL